MFLTVTLDSPTQQSYDKKDDEDQYQQFITSTKIKQSNPTISSIWCTHDKLPILTKSSYSKRLKQVIKIHRGYCFNIFTEYTEDDEMMVFGYIRNIGVIPTPIISICITYFGAIYYKYWSVGKNGWGQCGIGHHHDKVDDLTEIHDLHNIKTIGLGVNTTSVIWIQNDGAIYVNGRNEAHQLGVDDNNNGKIYTPILCDLSINKSVNPVQAACSEYVSFIVCDDGSVWSSGFSMYGENGFGDNPSSTNTFTKIKTLKNIVDISVGFGFSLFLCKEGNVFSCGNNQFKCLGIGDVPTDSSRLPTEIQYLKKNNIKIKKIECGIAHCMALTINGNIYSWGSNEEGQCGIAESENDEDYIPKLVETLKKETIIDIKTGSYHSGAVTKQNIYYLWGSNICNECLRDRAVGPTNYVMAPYNINDIVYNTTKSRRIIDMTLGNYTTTIITH